MSNVLKNPNYLESYNLYFQYTITGYSKVLEPNVPTYDESIKTLEGLLKKYHPKAFNIRFDPILLSTTGEVNPTPNKPGLARLNMFERLCSDLKTIGMDKCKITTSYVTLYPIVKERLRKCGVDFIDIDEKIQIEFMKRMVDISTKYGHDIYACANDKFVNAGINVKKSACIDGDILGALYGPCTKANDAGQRGECSCVKSRDIGFYDVCKHACKYCYNSKSS